MSYQIRIIAKAEKELKALPLKEYQRIDAKIVELADDARPIGYKKIKGQVDTYRIRVGNYRVVYRIEEDVLVIEVIRIAHRKEVYRK